MKREFPRRLLFDFVRSRSKPVGLLLDTLCQTATARGESLYVVGGVVRDVLLGDDVSSQPMLDLDIAIDADTSPYRAAIAATAGVSATHHERFDTASLTLSDGATMDLARTRMERYPAPGSLPIVDPAPIEIDLTRRDFTIHAAAVGLVGPDAGLFLDPVGAAADLDSRVIRVLHADSFRDDPTRLVRAAQYAGRIGGQVDVRTAGYTRRDRAMLGRLTAGRFGDAWRRLLSDAASSQALDIARKLKLPEGREPRWSLPARVREWPQGPESFWSCVGLTSRDPRIEQWLPGSAALTRGEQACLVAGVTLCKLRRSIGAMKEPSSVAAALGRSPDATLKAASRLWDGPSGDSVDMYLARRESVRSPISADRLSELGIERGPMIGQWLRRLEGWVWDHELDPHDPAAIARIEERIRLSR